MKVGDIVIVHILPRAIDKGIVIDKSIHDHLWVVDVAGERFWRGTTELEPVNCSIGKVWDRYAPRTLYPDYHDIVDRYTGKIVGKFRSHD